jgi:hypothetical protein
MKIFVSHFISMIIFSIIISTLLAFIKYDEKRDIWKYGLKLFIYMVGSVIVSSWIMYFL